MTLPETHLAAEAIAAYVDRELAAVPESRAVSHLRGCPECQAAVAKQRAAKTALFGAMQPAPSDALLTRLRDIPMTTDLTPPGVTLAMDGDTLVFSSTRPTGRVRADGSRRRDRDRRPRVPRQPVSRPASYRGLARQSAVPVRALSRGLAGAAAAVVVGVLVATSATTYAGSADPTRGPDGPPSVSPAVSQAGTTDVRLPSVPETDPEKAPLLARAAALTGIAR